MRLKTLSMTFVLMLLAMLAPLYLMAQPAAAEEPVAEGATTLTLLHNNDGESSLLPITYAVMTDTGYPNKTTVELPVGSVGAFKTLTDDNIAQAHDAGNSVVNVYAGDAFLASATLACSLPPNPADTPVYDAIAQRQIDYDAHILGNHEFDYSPDFLERFIRDFEVGGDLTQPFLSSNLDFQNEAGFNDLVDADGILVGAVTDGRVVAHSAIVTDEMTGQEFGIVGATTPGLASISTPRDVIITSEDLTETATIVQGEVDRLTDDYGINKIIFVSHLQDIDNDQAIVQMLSDVDVAVGGGGDELLVNPDVDQMMQLLPGETADIYGDYPLPVTDADGNTVYLVTSAGNYKYLGRLDVTFDDNGVVTAVDMDMSYPRRVMPTSDEAAGLGVTDHVAMDAGIVTSVNDPVEACLEALAEEPVARTEVLLDVSRAGVRGGESNAGNLIADSFLHVYDLYGGGDTPVIAVQNGGGIRQNAGDVLPVGGVVPGTIVRLDTMNVLPFFNYVSYLENVTPADVKTMLEHTADGLPGQSGRFLQVAGFNVTYDVNAASGSRVITVQLTDGTMIVEDGAIAPGAPNVTLLTNSFVARGGDGYDVLGTYPATNLLDGDGVALTYESAWLTYLQSFAEEEGLPTIQDDDPRYQPGGEGRVTIIEPTAVGLADLGTTSTAGYNWLAVLGMMVITLGLVAVVRRRA